MIWVLFKNLSVDPFCLANVAVLGQLLGLLNLRKKRHPPLRRALVGLLRCSRFPGEFLCSFDLWQDARIGRVQSQRLLVGFYGCHNESLGKQTVADDIMCDGEVRVNSNAILEQQFRLVKSLQSKICTSGKTKNIGVAGIFFQCAITCLKGRFSIACAQLRPRCVELDICLGN